MKITKIHITSFGKLKNYELDASDALISVNEENGWGKSTLATFIKCMFYGLSDGKRDVEKNERKHYRPWNETGLFGGYAEFKWKDEEYRIERFFGAKESEDSVKLIDLKTGKIYLNPENLGERIFGVDEEGFLSTAYYSEADFEIKNNTSLAAKFNDGFSQKDSTALGIALKKIEEKMRVYKIRGDKGLIADAKTELFRAQEEYERLNAVSSAVDGLKAEIEKRETSVAEKKKKLAELNDKLAAAGKAEAVRLKEERLKEVRGEIEDLNKKKEEGEKFFGGYYPTKGELDRCAEEYRKAVNLSAEEKAAEQAIAFAENSAPTVSKSSLPVIFFVVAAIIAAGAAVFFALNVTVLAIVLVVCCLGFAAAGAAVLKKGSSNKEVLNGILEKRERLNYIREKKRETEDGIRKFTGRFGLENTDAVSAVSAISFKLNELKSVVEEIRAKTALYESLLKDEDLKGEARFTEGVSVERLKEEFSSVKDSYTEEAQWLADKKSTLIRYEESLEKRADLESRISELKEKTAEYSHEYDILSKTLDFLKSADEKLKNTYRAPLENALNKYLRYIADGREITAKIDLDLKVSIEENGTLKESGYYSKGYKNLFDLCKRFALIEVLFKKEKPFVILDDPFFNLDDGKAEKAKQVLRKLSEEYQIIYFVCHSSRTV